MKHSNRKRAFYQDHACYDNFICKVCERLIVPEHAGSQHRNHCPHCLSSLHVDDTPGDRSADCDGIMEPISVWVRKNGEWAMIHHCTRCGHLSLNRIAADDNPIKLMSIALKPLAQPPFPLEHLEKIAAPLFKPNLSENGGEKQDGRMPHEKN